MSSTITECSSWNGNTLTVAWCDSRTLPPRELITQASGVCFSDSGRIVLVGDGSGCWSLPGGHPEAEETAEEALTREVLEEACATVEQRAYLGAQRVDNSAGSERYYQTRWWARVRLLPFEPKHETTARKLITSEELVQALNWKTT